MTTARTVAHPGWLVVHGPQLDAVVAAGEGDAESLEAAAAGGLPVLLEALTTHGLAAAPDFAACAPIATGLRVVLRGAAVVVLPDGTRLEAQDRMPWLDVDLDLAQEEVGEVSLEAPAPAPERSRGWQLPARLRLEPAEPNPPVAVSARTELLPVAGFETAPASDADPPASDAESPVSFLEPTHRVVPAGTLEVPTPTAELPPQEARPTLGVLRLSTGGSVPLDRGVLLGRAPRVDEDQPADRRPRVVRVGGPDRDISRNHAEVVLEGRRVFLRDLGSTNGTTVTRPGQEPVRLRPHADQEIEPGAVVSLANEVQLTYEVQE